MLKKAQRPKDLPEFPINSQKIFMAVQNSQSGLVRMHDPWGLNLDLWVTHLQTVEVVLLPLGVILYSDPVGKFFFHSGFIRLSFKRIIRGMTMQYSTNICTYGNTFPISLSNNINFL
ncbi:hypothetical protein AVEN_116772-1 [Araneus ventricosus]|uniref:Uncharacterized protein n=1 Tax=Araneus ventricosus TaxID=182803 RepID=A0A4Y2D8L9_ARAVE|nr:hypothetical protein AVEN_116772-1 [Araneus ventricosus]